MDFERESRDYMRLHPEAHIDIAGGVAGVKREHARRHAALTPGEPGMVVAVRGDGPGVDVRFPSVAAAVAELDNWSRLPWPEIHYPDGKSDLWYCAAVCIWILATDWLARVPLPAPGAAPAALPEETG